MDRKTYERTLEKEMVGRKVRTLVALRNGYCHIPPGAIATVKRKFKGLELLSDPCSACGVRISISRVGPRDVEFIDSPKLNGKEVWKDGKIES